MLSTATLILKVSDIYVATLMLGIGGYGVYSIMDGGTIKQIKPALMMSAVGFCVAIFGVLN